MKHNNNIRKYCWNINIKQGFGNKKRTLVIGTKNKDKCSKHVCVNHIDEIHGCSKRIPQTRSRRREGVNSHGCVDNIKEDAQN